METGSLKIIVLLCGNIVRRSFKFKECYDEITHEKASENEYVQYFILKYLDL